MWDLTKKFLKDLTNMLRVGEEDKGLFLQFTLGRAEAELLGEELSRLINSKETLQRIRNMKETAKDPAIRMVTCLYDTVDPMVSKDYKDRFYAEYWQLKIRYEKLKKRNTMTEAYRRVMEAKNYENVIPRGDIKELPHDCPNEMLVAQQRIMEEYLHVMELRAVLEGIVLDPEA